MFKVNGQLIPDRMTHDEAADLFFSTAIGRSTGITRAEFMAKLRQLCQTEDDLAAWLHGAKARLEAAMAPAAGPYALVDHGHAIRCNTCMKTSWASGDVLHRYCSSCKKFHV